VSLSIFQHHPPQCSDDPRPNAITLKSQLPFDLRKCFITGVPPPPHPDAALLTPLSDVVIAPRATHSSKKNHARPTPLAAAVIPAHAVCSRPPLAATARTHLVPRSTAPRPLRLRAAIHSASTCPAPPPCGHPPRAPNPHSTVAATACTTTTTPTPAPSGEGRRRPGHHLPRSTGRTCMLQMHVLSVLDVSEVCCNCFILILQK
jgi:hypothetical protein